MRAIRSRGAAGAGLVLAALPALAAPGVAVATVFLNEVTIQGPEMVELYNSGPDSADVNGWTIQESGSWQIQNEAKIAPGEYLVVCPGGDILDDQGGYIELLELNPEDGVYYGQQGSAPLPPENSFTARAVSPPTLARAPDASSLGGAITPSPSTDGTIWTLDLTPTLGAANDAPTPALGTSILLNELNPKPVGGHDVVELYNPFAAGISVSGWVLCNGDDFLTLAGTVPATGHLTIDTGAGYDLETDEVVYLFRDDGVRVDQIGLHQPPVRGMPSLAYCQCFARVSDGSGPNLGYDYFTSGGDNTLLRVLCTLGSANQNQTSCTVTGAAEPVLQSWGRTKLQWR